MESVRLVFQAFLISNESCLCRSFMCSSRIIISKPVLCFCSHFTCVQDVVKIPFSGWAAVRVAVTLLELLGLALPRLEYSFQMQLCTPCAEEQNPAYIQRFCAFSAVYAVSAQICLYAHI